MQKRKHQELEYEYQNQQKIHNQLQNELDQNTATLEETF